ncbi:GNAT family N-acetyltransferase [Aeromonas taiwanensis]|uniref:GNAT family N-acetyltransferase n=1 Tax=Aeromonas taiwanensis TaxID=633417 RepID=UPI0005C25E47|nr:GNAT family N-acetyltransferase [Aeromonas taiwanensis]
MVLLIEGALWRPHWQGALLDWQRQGHRWCLLLGKREVPAPWVACPPDEILSASALLSAWLGDAAFPVMTADPSQQILIAASGALLTLAREHGLLTLGPAGADHPLRSDDDLGHVLQRLLARRLTTPVLRDAGTQDSPALVLRPLQPGDESAILCYCSDEAIARYTLNIPHPYPPESARDWLAMSGRKTALGLGRTWALTLPEGEESAPLIGAISLHWHGELAWWLGVPWQRRGLATRAGHLVRQFAFEQLHLPALTARHMPGNLASGRVMVRLGMHHCGRWPDSVREAIELDHWRLDRAPSLPTDLMARLAPLLADEQVVVAILHDESGGDAALALFMAGKVTEGEQTPCGLRVRRYPFTRLEPDAPAMPEHGGGVLLKEQGRLGLAYLLRCAGQPGGL